MEQEKEELQKEEPKMPSPQESSPKVPSEDSVEHVQAAPIVETSPAKEVEEEEDEFEMSSPEPLDMSETFAKLEERKQQHIQ